MSCGNPHDVDCVEVIQQVYLYLDGEIDESHRVEVSTHLEECAPCLQQFGLYDDVKKLVGRCCGGEVASSEFKQRVRAKLAEVQIEITAIEVRDT
jgi:mycothiol system anti-sigma-R factor